MNKAYARAGSLALKPGMANPKLRIVESSSSFRAVPSMSEQLFGFLSGHEFESTVHDVLNGTIKFKFFSSKTQLRFAVVSAMIAAIFAFVASFA